MNERRGILRLGLLSRISENKRDHLVLTTETLLRIGELLSVTDKIASMDGSETKACSLYSI